MSLEDDLRAEVEGEEKSGIQLLREVAKKVRVLKDTMDDYKEKIADLDEEYKGQRDLLSQQMTEAGMQKYEFTGVGLFYMSKVGHVKPCVPVDTFAEKFIDVLGLEHRVKEVMQTILDDPGLRRRVAIRMVCDIISPTIKDSDLKAWYNELLEGDEDMAKQFEPVLNVFVENRLNIRNPKGGKNVE